MHKINVKEYLEEACHADVNVGESSTNIEPVTIRDRVNNNMNDIECNEINSNDTMDNHEFIQMIKNYLAKMYNCKKELIQAGTVNLEDSSNEKNALKDNSNKENVLKEVSDNENILEDESDKENIFSSIQLRNPLKVTTKSRPKSVSYCKNNNKINKHLIHNNSKQKHSSDHNNGKQKHGPNLCSYCKESGHNIVRCPKKSMNQYQN
ncbi:36773_t:CDS:2 [Gigaspora margarita]|uniref:36773_t:CDS:1 n=1 Tax=Gigaspora margarita TaxID=4874 RepID=A0ABN7VJN0_GIGMA|nr:36773_t:CDS:2 [Gigaspora margarita]